MPAYAGVDTVTLLHQGMRVASLNHRIIANNIANVDTPNYNPAQLDFQATLRGALEGRDRFSLRTTRLRHLNAQRDLFRYGPLAILSKNDYNKVDLEHEAAQLDKNAGRYTTYGSLLVKHFQQVKNVLNNAR